MTAVSGRLSTRTHNAEESLNRRTHVVPTGRDGEGEDDAVRNHTPKNTMLLHMSRTRLDVMCCIFAVCSSWVKLSMLLSRPHSSTLRPQILGGF